MLERSDKERLAVLETNTEWIKESMERIELGQKESSKSLERHLLKHPNGNGNGGVQIIVGKKAMGLIASALATGPIAALLVYLRSQGLF